MLYLSDYRHIYLRFRTFLILNVTAVGYAVMVLCEAGSTLKRDVPPAVFAAITEHTPGVSQSSTVSTRTQRQHSVD